MRLRVASPPGTHRRDGAAREPTRALFAPPIANLKPASPLALDDDVAVQRAQFDLAKVTASGIDLFRNQGRAFSAVACSTRRSVAASVYANGRWFGIEIGLQHSERGAGVNVNSYFFLRASLIKSRRCSSCSFLMAF